MAPECSTYQPLLKQGSSCRGCCMSTICCSTCIKGRYWPWSLLIRSNFAALRQPLSTAGRQRISIQTLADVLCYFLFCSCSLVLSGWMLTAVLSGRLKDSALFKYVHVFVRTEWVTETSPEWFIWPTAIWTVVQKKKPRKLKLKSLQKFLIRGF